MAVKKVKQTTSAKKAVNPKKVSKPKSGPSEEEIRLKAEEIYHERVARGGDGTPEDDWLLAERLLKAEKK